MIFRYFILYQNQNIIKENMNQQQQQSNKLSQPVQSFLELTNQQKLEQKIIQLEAENKKLKLRIAQMQHHKQKNLKTPNKQKIQELFTKFQVKKFAFKVCYLGFDYDGMAYQKANDDNTVEAHIFKAFHTMSLIKNSLPGDDYTRAGRTDKGVSAMGNVISLRLRSNYLINLDQCKDHNPHKTIEYCSMLNAVLPEDIRILACSQVQDDFNARYWCTKRSYKYFFPKNGLNILLMKEAIKDFVGTHNFINYCKMNLTNTVNFQRTIFMAQIIKSEVNQIFQTEVNEVYYFYFVGNSFLWHQIRFMTSVLFLIGSGQEKPSLVGQLLDLNKFPKKPNYPMAPEYALILQDCEYPNLKLQPDLKTTLSFYKTFNEIIMKKSTQKTLVINCIMMAQRDLMSSMKITKQYIIQQYLKMAKKTVNKGGKTLSMHKSSGRSFQQAKQSLKGKKLELFKNKMIKQQQFEKKQRQSDNKQKDKCLKNNQSGSQQEDEQIRMQNIQYNDGIQ